MGEVDGAAEMEDGSALSGEEGRHHHEKGERREKERRGEGKEKGEGKRSGKVNAKRSKKKECALLGEKNETQYVKVKKKRKRDRERADGLLSLPREILCHVFEYLSLSQLHTLARCCWNLFSIIKGVMAELTYTLSFS